MASDKKLLDDKVGVLIVYDSKEGRTKKMAFGIAEGVKKVKGASVIVKNVDETENEDLLKADAIIIGSPTYYGQMSMKIKDLFDKSVKIHGKLDGKVGAAFTSSGGTATGAETTLLSILESMMIHGMIVQGRSEDKHYGAAALNEPNQKDLGNCRNLGERTAKLTLKLRSK